MQQTGPSIGGKFITSKEGPMTINQYFGCQVQQVLENRQDLAMSPVASHH